MERRAPRAPPAAAWKPRRLARWELRNIARVVSMASAAGARAVQMHGAVVYFRNPEREQPGRGQQQASAAVVGDAPTASSAEPKPLSKRKQRSAMRLAEFRRQKELRSAQLAAARLKRLWSVVWLQRLVRRWMGERRLAAGSARVRWTGADAGLRREVQAEGLEERVATVGEAANRVAAAAEEEAAGGWLARWRVAQPRAAVPELPPPLESGAGAPSAAAGKRRVDFSAPVPPSKRAWVVPGIGAGWLRWLAQGEREAREAEAAVAAEAEAVAEAARGG